MMISELWNPVTEPVREKQILLRYTLPEDDELRRYRQLASAVGLTRCVPSDNLLGIIQNEIPGTYDLDTVERYLTKNLGRRWGWRYTGDSSRFGWKRPGSPLNGPYTKPVPYEVLLTMEKLLQHNSYLRFYISDLATKQDATRPDPDPFLAVTDQDFEEAIKNNRLFVIERWDEPAFRQKKGA